VLQENYDIFRRVYGPEDPDTLDAAQTLGFYLAQRRGDAFGTIKLLQPVVQIETARYGADNARTLFSSLVLASAYQIAGKNDEALALLEPRMPAFLKVYGETHSHTVWAMRLMASCYRDAGKLEQAQAMFDRAIESGRKTFGDHDGRVQSTRVRMAEMWLEHGRIDEAEKLIREVLHKEFQIGVAGGNSAVALAAEGRVLRLRHRPADALVRFEGAMGAVTVGVRTDIRHPARAEVAYWMGLCLLDLDRPADAAMCLREAADTYALRCGENTDLTRRARAALAKAEQAVAQHAGAPPTTQPMVGYGIPADEITWFERLAMVARDEQLPDAALQYAQLAVKYCTIRQGKDSPRTQQVQRYLDQLQSGQR
jgi:tetratricopeptide (TPR) repeat protein